MIYELMNWPWSAAPAQHGKCQERGRNYVLEPRLQPCLAEATPLADANDGDNVAKWPKWPKSPKSPKWLKCRRCQAHLRIQFYGLLLWLAFVYCVAKVD